MKEYTVTEVAMVLIEQGVIRRDNLINKNKNGATKFSTGEPQVRLWIREYNKVFEQEYKEYLDAGEEIDNANKYAHTKALRYGIRATMESRKQGYRIQEHDLKEFISYKLGSDKENNLIYELKSLKKKLIKDIKYSKGPLQSEWFEKGFESAINFFENNFLLGVKPQSKEVLQLPKNDWFIDESSITITNYKYRQINNSAILWINFKNKQLNQLDFKLRVNKNNEEIETKIDWALSYAIISMHFRSELESILSDKNNITVLKQILLEKIPEDEANKLAILMLLSL